ncbi:MAG: single-stranded DNA-binding protein [Clostridia bacterium]|nr:single-stranded DNA-binding protein [Clostridia bacterium]
MNKAILMGRLTRDPEMRQTQSGVSVANFSIAINRRFQKDQTDFINCIAWRQTAEFVCKWFQKGSMIAVVGSIQTRRYTDSEGKERTATEVVADEAYFTGSRAESGTGGSGQDFGGGHAPAPAPSFNNEVPQFDQGGFGTIDDTDDDLPF